MDLTDLCRTFQQNALKQTQNTEDPTYARPQNKS